MDALNKTISRDGKISKVDFRERLAPVKQEDLEEYIKSKGRKYTLLKLVEEMAELQKEILKDVNCGEKDKDAILEEIGDVEKQIEGLTAIIKEVLTNNRDNREFSEEDFAELDLYTIQVIMEDYIDYVYRQLGE